MGSSEKRARADYVRSGGRWNLAVISGGLLVVFGILAYESVLKANPSPVDKPAATVQEADDLDDAETATIFVSISAYRDDQCAGTLLDMYHKADHPHRVFTHAVAYVKRENTSLAEHCQDRTLGQYSDLIEWSVADYQAAKGPTYTRWHCATKYRGQKYFMQIDSHMKFVPGWDTGLIEMLHKAPSKKPVLTHYPASYEQADLSHVSVICKSHFNDQNITLWNALLIKPPPGHFPITPLVAGGFFFTYGRAVVETPFDPGLDYLFNGEEVLYSARLWTQGWDFFAPNDNLVFHWYGRKGCPRFWEDLPAKLYVDGRTKTHEMLERIMTGNAPGYSYGMGRARTLQEYLDWAQVNWKNHSSTSNDKFCKGLFAPGWNVTHIKRRYANRTMPARHFQYAVGQQQGGMWPRRRAYQRSSRRRLLGTSVSEVAAGVAAAPEHEALEGVGTHHNMQQQRGGVMRQMHRRRLHGVQGGYVGLPAQQWITHDVEAEYGLLPEGRLHSGHSRQHHIGSTHPNRHGQHMRRQHAR